MRKVIAMFLTLCLLCGAIALAEPITEDGGTATTALTYEVLPNTTYTVTIPPRVDLDRDQMYGFADFVLDPKDVNVEGFTIEVTLSSAANGFNPDRESFWLKNSNYTLEYDVVPFVEEAIVPVLGLGDVVLSWTRGEDAQEPISQTILFNILSKNQEIMIAGEYTDTLTFRIAGGVRENP